MKTEITETRPGELLTLLDIYNACASGKDVLYRSLSGDEFTRIFSSENRFTYAAYADGLPAGFASASVAPNGVSYLTYVGVAPEYRGNGIGGMLLDALEDKLKSAGAARTDTVFYDPASLPWIIPGTRNGHPCAPGTPSGSHAEKLLLSRGYSEWCTQIAYYLDLSEYSVPEVTAEKEKRLVSEGFSFELYSQDKHHGLETIFDRIGNPGWKNGVLMHPERPTVVAVDNSKDGYTIGFIGALCPGKEGEGIRGNFCGVGTDPEYRGRSIATVLFAKMCEFQRSCGATFMSLYTGETMSARRVYEAAGCRPVARWSNLRKIYI